jgi:hypothetical protein
MTKALTFARFVSTCGAAGAFTDVLQNMFIMAKRFFNEILGNKKGKELNPSLSIRVLKTANLQRYFLNLSDELRNLKQKH